MTEYLDRYPTMHEYAEGKRIDPKLTDLISRADAICEVLVNDGIENIVGRINALPSAETTGALDDAIAKYVAEGYMLPPDGDFIRREDAMGAVQDHFNANGFRGYDDGQKMMDRINALPSADRPTESTNTPTVFIDGIGHFPKLPSADRPTGEFEIRGTSNGLNGTMYYKCSLCGTPVDPSDQFCRGCGARMKAR